MNNNIETKHIKRCLELIEERLKWGDSINWTGYDFEKLSIEIKEHTGVILSVTTLKRLWGKLKYANIPTITTLNTLASFAGYESWRVFKLKISPGQPSAYLAEALTEKPKGRKPLKKIFWMLPLIAISVIVFVLLLIKIKSKAPIDNSLYQFNINKIKTEGVPNSVIFTYDAKSARDSVFISQSWDVSRKVAVSFTKNTYSSIYYKPGYYRAKLIIGKQVVKEQDLMIASGGWICMVDNDDNVPLYFKKGEVIKNDIIHVDEQLLAQYHIFLQPSLPKLRFYNIGDMAGLKSDHFSFETSLKSDFQKGTAACQRVEVLIMLKDDVIRIPLSSLGCVGDLSLYVAGKTITSKDSDLSAFGGNLKSWVKLKVESQNQQIRFYINGVMAYSLKLNGKASDLVGVQFRFNGTGAIKNTQFRKDQQIISF